MTPFTKLILVAIAFLTTVPAATAGTICPGGNTTNFVSDPDPAGTGCNTLITINADNTVSITIPDDFAYDGSDDNLVGVLNNSATAVTALFLTGSDIFGLDGDGVCRFTFSAANGVADSSYCNDSQTGGTDPQDYYGPTTTFDIVDFDSGTVNLDPGIAGGGGRTFFSLEESPSALLTVTIATVPEPASFVLVVSGLLALALYHRTRACTSAPPRTTPATIFH